MVVVRASLYDKYCFMLAKYLQYYTKCVFFIVCWWRLRGLAVACSTTDHYHPCSNPGVGISEGCFVFHFVSLPLEVARPI